MANGTCAVPECGRMRHGRQSYCKMHYSRWRRNGHTDPVAQYRSVCEVEGCGKPHLSRGMCPMHYRRWKVNGDPNIVQKVRGERWCYAEGCDLRAVSLGLCDRHYRRMRAYGSTELPPRLPRPCEADGCLSDAVARGLCNKHYRRLMAHGAGGLTKGDPRTCTQDSCEAPYYAHGVCRKHYDDVYREANRARIAGYQSSRRGKTAVGMSREEIAEALEYRTLIANDPCVYCDAPADTVDHIEAVHAGGSDRWTNLAPACRSCNSSKKVKTPLEFLLWRLDRDEGAVDAGATSESAGAL
jgi:5-methylcytosine-specific restriction endonuclease McrA